jgi:heme/copper-type cytochrome/quinol oxidase subunit 2
MLSGAGSDGVPDTSNADVYCNAECRRQWLCTLSGTTTVKQYNKCLYEKKKAAGGHSTITGVMGVFVFAVAFVVMASIAARLMRRRIREQYELIEGNVEMEGP